MLSLNKGYYLLVRNLTFSEKTAFSKYRKECIKNDKENKKLKTVEKFLKLRSIATCGKRL